MLGDDRYGARVLLKKERGMYVVDDVLLISGPESRQRIEMKNEMRLELSRFRGNRPTKTVGTPLQTSRTRQPAARPAIQPSFERAADLTR